MTHSELREIIEEIYALQPDRSIILTGFYLTSEQEQLLRSDLEPDDPHVGAIGRYYGIPVFLSHEFQQDADRTSTVKTETHRGIGFGYVQMDIVN